MEIGLEKSADLNQFAPFPMTPQQTSISPEGKLEFRFTTNDDAAFFLLEADKGN